MPSGRLPEATAEALGFLLRRLNRTLEELRFGDSPRLALELGLFSALESAHDLGAWLARLEALEKRFNAGGGGPAISQVPAQKPSPAPAPKPSAPPPASVAGNGPTWEAFVEAVSKVKISLGATLQNCAHEVRPDGGWTLRFVKPFDRDMALRSQAFLADTLAGLAGRALSVELALGGTAPAAPTMIVDTGVPESPGGAPAGTRWKDVTGAADADGPNSLRKAEGVFGGKAPIVKKPAP